MSKGAVVRSLKHERHHRHRRHHQQQQQKQHRADRRGMHSACLPPFDCFLLTSRLQSKTKSKIPEMSSALVSVKSRFAGLVALPSEAIACWMSQSFCKSLILFCKSAMFVSTAIRGCPTVLLLFLAEEDVTEFTHALGPCSRLFSASVHLPRECSTICGTQKRVIYGQASAASPPQ